MARRRKKLHPLAQAIRLLIGEGLLAMLCLDGCDFFIRELPFVVGQDVPLSGNWAAGWPQKAHKGSGWWSDYFGRRLFCQGLGFEDRLL